MTEESTPTPSTSRNATIDAVRTPLGFFALSLLIFEAVFGAIALLSQGSERQVAMSWMAGGIAVLVLFVAFFAYHRPEALAGARYRPDPLPPGSPSLAVPAPQSNDVELAEQLRTALNSLDTLHSIRLQVLAVLGAQSADANHLKIRLALHRDEDWQRLMSVIGKLVEDGTIESDRYAPAGTYRLSKRKAAG